jgi:hypothetical protein
VKQQIYIPPAPNERITRRSTPWTLASWCVALLL